MHRELYGMQPTTMFEFTGDTLSEILAEVALWAAGQEAGGTCPTLSIRQEWNEEDNFVIFVYKTVS